MRKRRGGKLLAAVLAAGMVLSLCGCGGIAEFAVNPQELYRLPELPDKYMALNSQLNAILDAGAEYAAPISGTNIQPVQMVDLDGDGREEAVAFFRAANDEKPLKICIFSAQGESYEQAAVIEGSGTAIYSIAYQDMDGDKRTELAVSWRVSTELQALTVYALDPEHGPVELLQSDCVKYTMTDLNGNGREELTILRADQDGGGIADCYGWINGTLTKLSSARISMTMGELSRQGRITEGVLHDGIPALFVTGVTDSSRAITDVLIMQESGELVNTVLSAVTGVSSEITLFRGLYPSDINDDGITEVPWPILLQTWDNESGAYQQIDWKCYDTSGGAETVLSTYHNMEDGWYLEIPRSWANAILVDRSVSVDEADVTFYVRGGDQQATRPFLRISVLTGTNRERRAVRSNRLILSRSTDAIYVAELMEGNGSWEYGITEDDVRAAFHLISAEWIGSYDT